ncbi:GGDEF domain-containing protein [Paracoccus sp. Z330]|uniref:diguanylate cyclase n=1 Tax=Paracoccus onchidii TaxID=3017813 RepID=A0ABT4ZCU6_9RHOB|nr:GGDEF domain-containing protein [Paracoccus onchidii]MDB6176957.1 GGDEF domain-containing protein [Paracoccus onchidii]
MQVAQPGVEIMAHDLGRLLPMHFIADSTGRIERMGPTLRKLLPQRGACVRDLFSSGRRNADGDILAILLQAATQGDRLFLRVRGLPDVGLRGHAIWTEDRKILVNLGFGIDLVQAVGHASLTDGDFAPPELAMELLFMREAMQGLLGELSRYNRQLDLARESAELRAHTDALTGVRNRRGMEADLGRAFSTTLDDEDAGFAIAHIDLDHFKHVNDLLGHAAGDRLLCQVAQVLTQATRGHDTVARCGGDEFIVILRNLTDVATLERLASRMIAAIEALMAPETGCPVSASIGIVLSPGYRDLSLDRMLLDADAALYQSKHDGRGRVTVLSKPLADCI